MGCCSSDALPPIPKEVKPDPDVNAPMTVVVRRIGNFFGRDYSVHEGVQYPSSSTDVREKMWLWFNKSNVKNLATIDLENFSRGHKEDKNKGKILYTASFTDVLQFEQFQRLANTGFECFGGFFGANTYKPNDDNFYLGHTRHSQIRNSHNFNNLESRRKIGPDMITKWRLITKATIRDGDCGRAADLFQGEEVVLDVYSTGTAFTEWEEIREKEEIRNDEGKVTGHRINERIIKHETEYVDRIEFRLSFRGQMWAEWYVEGDANPNAPKDIDLKSPFFNTSLKGGWFKPNEYLTSTLPGVDGPFALLLSHLCASEYSVEAIKKDLKPNTPAKPPSAWSYGVQAGMSLFAPPPSNPGQFNPMWK